MSAKPAQHNFATLYQASDSEMRYQLDERAAIHEFDGGLTRMEAEQRTFEEACEAAISESSAKIKELLEAGEW